MGKSSLFCLLFSLLKLTRPRRRLGIKSPDFRHPFKALTAADSNQSALRPSLPGSRDARSSLSSAMMPERVAHIGRPLVSLSDQLTGARPILASSCTKLGSLRRLAKLWSQPRFSMYSSCDWKPMVRYLSASRLSPSRASVCATT